MALSYANHRRRAQQQQQQQQHTSVKSWALQKQASVLVSSSASTRQQHMPVRKQYSFIETTSGSQKYTAAQRAYLTRGLSVERSIESIRQKLYTTTCTSVAEPQKLAAGLRLSRHSTVDVPRAAAKNHSAAAAAIKQLAKLSSNDNANTSTTTTPTTIGLYNSSNSKQQHNALLSNALLSAKLKERNLIAWSSTTSLLKNFDNDIAVHAKGSVATQQQKETVDALSNNNNKSKRDAPDSNKSESNRINLNIVLAQTIRATTEQEAGHSDIECAADCVDVVKPTAPRNLDRAYATSPTATQRRAEYLQSRATVVAGGNAVLPATVLPVSYIAANNNNNSNSSSNINCNNISNSSNSSISSSNSNNSNNINYNIGNNNSSNSNNNNNNHTQLSISPALTVQRRPPLVRAMSAPVRGLDESAKSVIAANKRQQKLRRRKILTRNVSCDKSPGPVVVGDSDILSTDAAGGGGGNKKLLTRARTVAAPDVITLVSLLSSEGSDSEREDNSCGTTTSNGSNRNEPSPNRRAPLLRKTGKSVSFQDNYPAAFQLASKEYSHMLRRGSIAPLAARLRSNRPPTAPPVSIFLSDSHGKSADPTSSALTVGGRKDMAEGASAGEAAAAVAAAAAAAAAAAKPNSPNSEKENNAANCNVQEYVYPDYVRSIKERECWKLFQKMCAKGVTVSYDTILRGMLTPTEFRQLQKQRDIEEAKAKEAAEAAAETAANAAAEKPKASAIERLSESLLNNKKP